MPKKPPTNPATSDLKSLQAARLKALRELLTAFRRDVAEAVGVSEHSWGRYEAGKSEINPIALANFALFYDVPVEWVLTGRLTGMPDDLIRKIVSAYPHLLAGALSGTAEQDPPPDRPGRTRSSAARSPGKARVL
jgi:transcriptional regulator with XRE-family HTH domain